MDDLAGYILTRIVKDEGGCWNSQWCQQSKGYTTITRNDRPLYVHRVIYERLVGPIPDGMHIDHTCANRKCCNPDHLEVVTAAENNRRANARHPLGHIRRKTHCLRGHAYPDDRKPRTQCKICRREWMRSRRAA